MARLTALVALGRDHRRRGEQNVENLPLRAPGAEISCLDAFENQGFYREFGEKLATHGINPNNRFKEMNIMPRHRVFDEISQPAGLEPSLRRRPRHDTKRPIRGRGDDRVGDIGKRGIGGENRWPQPFD